MENNTSSVFQCPSIDPITWNHVFSTQATTISSIIATIIHFLIAPFAVFLNGAAIFLVFKFDALQNPRFAVIALVALTDFVSGLIVQPLFIAKELYHLLLLDVDCTLDFIFYNFSTMLWLITLTQLMCLTYERYVAIINPYTYHQRIRIKWMILLSVINWTVNILVTVLLNAYPSTAYVLDVALTTWVCLCLIAFIYLNVRISNVIRRQERRIATQESSVRHNNFAEDKHKRNVANTLKFLLIAFFIANIPIAAEHLYIYNRFNEVKEIRTSLYFALHPWVDVCLNLNTLLCPLIYGIRTKKLRYYFLRYFFRVNVLNYSINGSRIQIPRQNNNEQLRNSSNDVKEDITGV